MTCTILGFFTAVWKISWVVKLWAVSWKCHGKIASLEQQSICKHIKIKFSKRSPFSFQANCKKPRVPLKPATKHAVDYSLWPEVHSPVELFCVWGGNRVGAALKKGRVVYESKTCPKGLKTLDFIHSFPWLSHFLFFNFPSLKYYDNLFPVKFLLLIKNTD